MKNQNKFTKFEHYEKNNVMGFLGNTFGAIVKTALTPIAIVKDAVDVVTGEEPKNTKNLINSACKDAEKAIDNLTGD